MANEIPFHLYDADGAAYTVDVLLDRRDETDPHYDVDLVRSLTGRYGESLEQRLTLGEYPDRRDALSHQQAVEDTLADDGLAGLGEAVQQIKDVPLLYNGQYLLATFPPDAAPDEIAAAHLIHFNAHTLHSAPFAIGEAEGMDRLASGLEQHALAGDTAALLEAVAQTAAANGLRPPDGPLFGGSSEIGAPDPTPEYYFGYGLGPGNQPALEAVKTWEDGDARRFDTFTIAEYDTFDQAAPQERALETLLDRQGLEAAMNQAERLAVAGGYLDPQRDDPRVFFVDDAPPDPFTTDRQRELAEPQYSVGAISANGESFLDVMKTWGEDDYERLVIPQPTWEEAQLQAAMAFTLQANGDLQGAMHLVEQVGVDAGVIDPERNDPRLFTQGPLDPFTTLREEEIDDDLARYGVTWRETQAWAAELGPSSQELDTEALPAVNLPAEVENPYWRLDPIPVNDPDGELLGHALHMVVYDSVERDPDAVGSPAMTADEPFRMLEMAQFDTPEAADRFGKDFNGYLIPGLLDGPELAVEVARLEGLPAQWKTLEGDELKAYQNAELTLTRDPADWKPYNPNAERDARIAAEGLYSDPIQQFTIFNEDEDDPKVEPVMPDLDL